jgi:hypothetical protein
MIIKTIKSCCHQVLNMPVGVAMLLKFMQRIGQQYKNNHAKEIIDLEIGFEAI